MSELKEPELKAPDKNVLEQLTIIGKNISSPTTTTAVYYFVEKSVGGEPLNSAFVAARTLLLAKKEPF